MCIRDSIYISWYRVICSKDVRDDGVIQEKYERISSGGSPNAPRQMELNDLKEQADMYRNRMKEHRSQTDVLIAQRNGK